MKTIGMGIVLGTAVLLSACNTANGVGKDLRSAGSAVSEASGQDKKK
ncbi:entericidin A/B family lipoprotein [Sphingomonas silueang]